MGGVAIVSAGAQQELSLTKTSGSMVVLNVKILLDRLDRLDELEQSEDPTDQEQRQYATSLIKRRRRGQIDRRRLGE